MSEHREPYTANIPTTWREMLDERQRKAIAFAEIYVRDFNHGTIGHNDLVLIARLAEMLDIVAGIKEPPRPPAPEETRLGFGKYRDQTLGEIMRRDPDYIGWLAREARDETIRHAAQALLTPPMHIEAPRSELGPGPGTEQTEDLPF